MIPEKIILTIQGEYKAGLAIILQFKMVQTSGGRRLNRAIVFYCFASAVFQISRYKLVAKFSGNIRDRMGRRFCCRIRKVQLSGSTSHPERFTDGTNVSLTYRGKKDAAEHFMLTA